MKILCAVYSYTKSVAADSWLALMDRFLILEDDCIEEKAHVKANILQLIDIYYDALDAPKKGGRKVRSVLLFHHLLGTQGHYQEAVLLLTGYMSSNSWLSCDYCYLSCIFLG